MFGKLFKKKPPKAESVQTQPTNVDDLLEKAIAHNQALQEAHMQSWGMGEADRYDIDLESGLISWVFEDDKIVIAPATLIGTFNPKDNSFLWGWDHPMCPPADNSAANAVKTFAEEHNIEILQDRKISCALDETWNHAAIAVLLGDLQGCYRAKSGNGSFVILGFGEIMIRKI